MKVLNMPRDYAKEYREYHSKPQQKKNRAKRNKANRNSDCGPGQEVDHKVPLSKGGSNSPSNWRVVSKETNRKKGSKKMSSFDRLRLAIEEKTANKLIGMTYDPNNKKVLKLKNKYGDKWKSVLAKQRGIPESSIVAIKTAAPDGVERLPSGGIKYRGETFPGYNKPKTAPAGSKHKKRVLAKKGDKVKVVNFGARGYKHNYSAKAKKSYLARSAGIKGKDDKFSANYWSRRNLWPKNQKADGSSKRTKTALDLKINTPKKLLALTALSTGISLPVAMKVRMEQEKLRREKEEERNKLIAAAATTGILGAAGGYGLAKMASADDNFNTDYLENFISSSRK